MQSNVVAKSWDDAAYQQGILKAGQRRQRAKKPDEAIPMNVPLKCTNCNLPVNINFAKHCVCSIWDRGKRPVVA